MRMMIRLLLVCGLLLVAATFDPFEPAAAGGGKCEAPNKLCGKTCYGERYCCCDGKLVNRIPSKKDKIPDCTQVCKAARGKHK